MKYVEDQWEFDGHNRVPAIALGLSPVWLLGLLWVTNSNCCHAMNEPTAAGISPVEIVVFGLASLLMLIGTIALWRARSTRAALVAMFLLMLPAMVLYVFGPAFVLILGNLAASSRA